MKKLFAILLIIALLFSFAGCKNEAPETKGPDFVSRVSHTDYPGMEIQIESIQYNNENASTELTIAWKNQTDFQVVYGEAFGIERLENGKWVSCAMQELTAFTSIGYLLEAGTTREETYNLSFYYDVSAPGTYRFLTDCYISDTKNESTKCNLWAEFTIVGDETVEAKPENLEFHAQYIRTNVCQEGAKLPKVQVIGSLQELKDYYTANNGFYDLERRETVYSDTSIGFLDACDKYDEAFFEDGYLIFVVLEERSGSVRHNVDSVKGSRSVIIDIDREVPEVCTDDMAQWHIMVELSRENLVQSSEAVEVYVDNGLVVDGEGILYVSPAVVLEEPPQGTLITAEGNAPLTMGGYSWFHQVPGSELITATIADQHSRPLPSESLTPVNISWVSAESVYSFVEKTGEYALTDHLGFLVKLHFDVMPTSVSYTCWPVEPEKGAEVNIGGVEYFREQLAFFAKMGGYLYEISATWADNGQGFYGTANYYVYIIGQDHSHAIPTEAQTVKDPVTGYCGNTQTTLYVGNKRYAFSLGNSVTLTDILVNLDYQRNKTCRCMAEYTVDTEFGTGYEINLTEGFARYEKGQAELTQAQIDTIAEIIKWAETECDDVVICD